MNPRLVGTAFIITAFAVIATACSSPAEPTPIPEPTATPKPTTRITITEPWLRADIDPTAVYFTIWNSNPAPVSFTSVEADWAGEINMHQTVERDGLLMMEQIDGLSVPSGGSITLAPGGLHLMAQGLNSAIAEGDSVLITLLTPSGDRVEFTAVARGVDAALPGRDNTVISDDHDHSIPDDHDGVAMDVETHGVVFSSGTIPPGKSFEFNFDHEFKGIVVPYHNHLTGASGSIMVVDSEEATDAVNVSITESGYHPAELQIAPGTTVIWTNETDVAWTVLNGYHPDHQPATK